MNIQFREAEEGDIGNLLEMMQRFNAEEGYPNNKTLILRNLRQFFGDPTLGCAWLIEMNDTSVGYIVLTFGFSFEYQGRDAIVDEFFVEKRFRGKGMGGKTLEFVFERAAEMGIKALHLEVENRNIRASKLYKDAGFKGNDRALLTRVLDAPHLEN